MTEFSNVYSFYNTSEMFGYRSSRTVNNLNTVNTVQYRFMHHQQHIFMLNHETDSKRLLDLSYTFKILSFQINVEYIKEII